MKALLKSLVIWAFLVPAAALQGFRQPEVRSLPNLDKRQPPADIQGRLYQQKAEAIGHLKSKLPESKVDFDPVTGSPKFIRTWNGFLTGPNGHGRGIPDKAVAGIAADDPHRAVKGFLKEHQQLFGHGPEALNDAAVARQFVARHNGLKTVVWQQQLDGIPVFEAVLVAHTTRNGELVNVSSQFVPNVVQAADNGAKNRRALQVSPNISARLAAVIAANNVGDELPDDSLSISQPENGPTKKQKLRSGKLSGDIDVNLVWLPMDDKTLRLCWQIQLTSRKRDEMFRVLVDAETGEVLIRRNLTCYISPATYRVFVSDSPSPYSPGHTTPLTNQPALAGRVLVVTNAASTNASPNGWINDGDNETIGNNVDAHLDGNGDNQPDLPRPQGSPNRVFDFSLDLNQSPTTYSDAAVVQLFYWCNWMHDKLYDLGFTEGAGNFQMDNFGRGGFGNDPVLADAQDGSRNNDANFSTPGDGSSPRLQVGIWTFPSPNRDGDLDAEVILHEYTHGLSNRRVGGGIGIGALQSKGLGEGWSDFYALSLLSDPGDSLNGNYAFGAYVTFQDSLPSYQQNYYYGIRRYPYSIDLSKNPLTFKDIDPAQENMHSSVPRSPIAPPSVPVDEHNLGEIWCVTLWEARANLIAKYGAQSGNHLMLQLVTDAMNLCPANPTFLQARDAIFDADAVLTTNANYVELWRAFAKRGMGFFASDSGRSDLVSGVVESFALPDSLWVQPNDGVISSGPSGGPFSPVTKVYALTNIGTNSLTWKIPATENWLGSSPTNGVLAPGAGTNIVVSITSVASSLGTGVYTASLVISNETTGIAQTRDFMLRVAQPDFYTELFESSWDLTNETFTFTPNASASYYEVCRQAATNFPTDPAGGIAVNLADDSYAQINLSNNVSLYGTSTNVLFIGSNGYLTFGSGDDNYSPSVSAHFNRLRVSGLFADLNPATNNASVSWKETTNGLAVTFQRVSTWGRFTTNDFQIELLYNGMVRITYLRMDARGGLAGLSRGTGVPLGFVPSDLSTYIDCAPHLAVLVPATADEAAGVITNGGCAVFPRSFSTNLTVNLYTSDSSELQVPASTILYANTTNAFFNVSIVDDSVLDGTRTATIRAVAPGFMDGIGTMAIFDNETAVLSLDTPAELGEAAGSASVTVGLDGVPGKDVSVALFSSNTNTLQLPPVVVIPTGQTSAVFTATVLNNRQIDGDQSVMIMAHVVHWTDATNTIVIRDDESTNLTLFLPGSAREGNAVLPAAGRVSLSGTLTTNLLVSLSSDDTTEAIVPPMVAINAGQTSAVFDVTVVDDTQLDGTQVARIIANALGFSNAMASLAITDDEMPFAPLGPSPADLSSNNPINVDLSWSAGFGEGIDLVTNGGFELGGFTGWAWCSNGLSHVVINDGTFDPANADPPTPPFTGSFSALVTQTGAGSSLLWQDIAIPTVPRVTLSWADRIRNFGDEFSSNQEFRVELRNTNDAVLRTVFSTKPGDNLLNSWARRNFDISSFRGQTVRLTFVVEATAMPLDVHLDDIAVRASTPPETMYDVYFGTNSEPPFVGTTSNTTWDLPMLQPLATFYWKIVARRTGVTNSPVWQFSTAPSVSIANASVLEGDTGLTAVTLQLTLSSTSPAPVTVDFVTQNGTADTSDYVASSGTATFNPGETNASLELQVLGDTTYEAAETFFVLLTNAANAAISNGQAVVTILNDDPFLAAIPNRTIDEGAQLSFTANAHSIGSAASVLITDFEAFPTNAANGSVMFREPTHATVTSGYLNSSPNLAVVTNVFPAGHAGSKVLMASWGFSGSPSSWLALKTDALGATNLLPNPTIDFDQVLSFDIYVDRDLQVGLGLRETGTTNGIGLNGGSTGPLEFVGVSSKTSGRPNPTRLVSAGTWQTLSFNLPYEPVVAAGSGSSSGNGSLTNGRGVLDHLNFVPTDFSANYTVYLDNFSVVYSNALTFSLSNAPPNATINPTTGLFTWTPTEQQGPGVYTITVLVTDNAMPPTTGQQTFTVTVNEVNSTPLLASIPNATIAEENLLTFTCTAVNSDIPTNVLTYSLDDAPEGATIDPATGVFRWTPSEAQGPGVYPIIVRVTDDGVPNLSSTRTFYATVHEVNNAPVLAPVSSRTVTVGTPISFTATATDTDIPANVLTYSLLPGFPIGAEIDPQQGLFNWTPDLSQSPSTNIITIQVADDAVPSLTNAQSFIVRVVNEPIIQSIEVAGETVTLTWSAIPGRTYRVQSKTVLQDNWSEVPDDVVAGGPTASVTEAVNTAGQFFRVVEVP